MEAENERALTLLRFLFWSFFASFCFFSKPFPPYPVE